MIHMYLSMIKWAGILKLWFLKNGMTEKDNLILETSLFAPLYLLFGHFYVVFLKLFLNSNNYLGENQ